MLAEPGAGGKLSGTKRDVLVVARFDGCDARAIADYLFSFNAYSRHRYYYVLDGRRLDGRFDLTPFDVVVIFWSASLLGPDIAPAFRERLRLAPALKVVFLQDEYRDVRRLDAALAEVGAEVVLTCVGEGDHGAFYPHSLVPTLAATYSVLPAYVPASLERSSRPGHARPLDLGYRSRATAYYLGDLARAKVTLVERCVPACRARGLHIDASVRELDRLYGDAWLRFLASCRCALGSPSGASVIDFTGEIRRSCERFVAQHPEATYDEVRGRFFARVDGAHAIDTVSARVFESVAMGCTPALVRGAYGGVLEPERHYIPIEPDFSDLAAVLDRVADRAWCARIAETAHRELIASGRYSFRSFATRFDAILERHASPRQGRARSRAAFHAGRCLRHGQPFVPFRAAYVTLPVGLGFLGYLARRIALGRRRPGPIVGRALRNPSEFLHKLVDLALALRVEPLRRLLAIRLHDAAAAGAGPLWQLVEDLLKIDVVRRARAGTLVSTRPFAIEVSHDPASGVLLLISVGSPASRRTAAAMEAIAGAVRQVIWDHGELGLEVSATLRRHRVVTLSLGEGGVYTFQAISSLCRLAPARTVPQLGSLLRITTEGSTGSSG